MPAKEANCARIPLTTPGGRPVGSLTVSVFGSGRIGSSAALITLDAETAERHGEPDVQLIEQGRYEYQLEASFEGSKNITLLAERGIQPSPIEPTRGMIEPGNFCGTLTLQLVATDDPAHRVVARAMVEVRSVKIDYRSHYRGMLRHIGEKSAGLLLDAHSWTKLSLASLWRRSGRIIEQQLEFLRVLLESQEFRIAIEQILRYPHRRLEEIRVTRSTSHACRADRSLARQIASNPIRRMVPKSHPIFSRMVSLPKTVQIRRRVDDYDVPENQFVAAVLLEFRDFLFEIEGFLSQPPALAGSIPLLLEQARRLRRGVDRDLAHDFFQSLSPLEAPPLGSPVLQRKAGYREVLRMWLQFHAAAQITWDGGPDVFAAGSRDVATLYEYWLFFALEELFRRKFGVKEPLHAILVDRSAGLPRLKLKRDVETTIQSGSISTPLGGRKLLATLHFNRRFAPKNDHHFAGSWTRAVRPDYTLTIWPDGFSCVDAEAAELLVHIHFDAKYRVDMPAELFGSVEDEETMGRDFEALGDRRTQAKYADLLKMHAYRDAVRRTAGAYVLYPGEPGNDQSFRGYHEIFPGLGAFAVRPREDGRAQGLESVERFLDDVVEHLASRMTARERVTYHVYEAYAQTERELDGLRIRLPERDTLDNLARARPPAEHQVLVAWYRSPEQLAWSRAKGKVIVRLGSRRGSLRIQPKLGDVRHILLHTRGKHCEPGLWRLIRPGFEIISAEELTSQGFPSVPDGKIYASFHAVHDSELGAIAWKANALYSEMTSRIQEQYGYRVSSINRLAPYPVVMPLEDLLLCIDSQLSLSGPAP
jgi:predicted component of viral defense system (DUF524 family)